jgi:glutathione S-transferase
MALVMYERVGIEQRRPSPFSWRIRYALTHKGLDVEYRPTRFADVATIKRLSGQHLVPIIIDGTTVVHDSWRIATYLEERFPDRPALFGDNEARAAARFINLWSDTLLLTLRRLIYANFLWCLAPEDRAYFRQSREKELGQTLEAACADRPQWQARFATVCRPLERLLSEQDFIAGTQPRYTDYIVFSVFQWARLGSPHEVVRPETALHRWRSRMIALFEGLGDRFPPYPADRREP